MVAGGSAQQHEQLHRATCLQMYAMLKLESCFQINALEEEMRELRLKLQHSEAKRQEIERRAAQQVLAMHGRLDAAQKLCVERLSQKQMLESELEALRKEHAEEVQERQRASADAQKAWTDLRRANAELANTTSELATSKATAAVLQREKAAAEKAYASEKAARDAIDDELQKCRSLIRELRARDDMRTSIRPRIAEQTAL
eukprot:CAMPEP_0182835650 /NCGR_PEP_ID=MMETSP0006_2-20121128/21628_1 /TAXON_ID=97485 /ORGANISM="Prymnesium parvum, Strain Texoma1" /LENGTH=200 /DNA_ID=CAMNT_0024964111 /DNA_START=319 /DNA_END=922 /DNA_ORIENTATION=+